MSGTITATGGIHTVAAAGAWRCNIPGAIAAWAVPLGCMDVETWSPRVRVGLRLRFGAVGRDDLAAGVRPQPPLTLRHRRRPVQCLECRLGGAHAGGGSRQALRRQHLLSASERPGVLGEQPRRRRAGRAGLLGHEKPVLRPQRRRPAVLRARVHGHLLPGPTSHGAPAFGSGRRDPVRVLPVRLRTDGAHSAPDDGRPAVRAPGVSPRRRSPGAGAVRGPGPGAGGRGGFVRVLRLVRGAARLVRRRLLPGRAPVLEAVGLLRRDGVCRRSRADCRVAAAGRLQHAGRRRAVPDNRGCAGVVGQLGGVSCGGRPGKPVDHGYGRRLERRPVSGTGHAALRINRCRTRGAGGLAAPVLTRLA